MDSRANPSHVPCTPYNRCGLWVNGKFGAFSRAVSCVRVTRTCSRSAVVVLRRSRLQWTPVAVFFFPPPPLLRFDLRRSHGKWRATDVWRFARFSQTPIHLVALRNRRVVHNSNDGENNYHLSVYLARNDSGARW